MNLKIGLLNSQKIMTFYNVPPGFKKYAVYQQHIISPLIPRQKLW